MGKRKNIIAEVKPFKSSFTFTGLKVGDESTFTRKLVGTKKQAEEEKKKFLKKF